MSQTQTTHRHSSVQSSSCAPQQEPPSSRPVSPTAPSRDPPSTDLPPFRRTGDTCDSETEPPSPATSQSSPPVTSLESHRRRRHGPWLTLGPLRSPATRRREQTLADSGPLPPPTTPVTESAAGRLSAPTDPSSDPASPPVLTRLRRELDPHLGCHKRLSNLQFPVETVVRVAPVSVASAASLPPSPSNPVRPRLEACDSHPRNWRTFLWGSHFRPNSGRREAIVTRRGRGGGQVTGCVGYSGSVKDKNPTLFYGRSPGADMDPDDSSPGTKKSTP